jgi:hypothetical protein
MLASLRICLALLLLTILPACPNRVEIRAHFFDNTGIPEHVCAKYPELWEFGMFRKLNDGKYEFVSYCKPEAQLYLDIYKDDLNNMLDKYLPEKRQGN